MQKKRLKSLDLEYWIGDSRSPDGLPVFTQAEVNILKKNAQTISGELMKKIWEAKRLTGGTLEEISSRFIEDDIFNQDPREELGYSKKEPTERLAKRYASQVIEQLRSRGAKTKEETPQS